MNEECQTENQAKKDDVELYIRFGQILFLEELYGQLQLLDDLKDEEGGD